MNFQKSLCWRSNLSCLSHWWHNFIEAKSENGYHGILEAWSENGCGKWPFLVWNRVRIWRTGRYTPTSPGVHIHSQVYGVWKKRWFAFIDEVSKGLWHGCVVQFLDNTSYAYLFAMELEKLPVKDKITASCQICTVCLFSMIPNVPNDNELWKPVWLTSF